MRLLFSLVLICSVLATVSFAEDVIHFGSFSESGLAGWKVKEFEGLTEYVIVKDGSTNVLRAVSHGAASGLVYEYEYNPVDYPILTWRWKIENTIAKGDSKTRQGDDYAARVYVIFPHWFFPKTKSLNYIWANKLGENAVQPNAFTGNAMMIAVESGAQKAGEWVEVHRNIVEDFRRAFGSEPPGVGAIAIMTDTDNTGESAKAWYGDISAVKE